MTMPIAADGARAPAPTRFSASLAAITAALRGIEGGTLHLQLPGRETLTFGDGQGEAAILRVRDARFARRVLFSGDIGFAEGWVAGEWDSPDLFALLALLAANGEAIARYIRGGPAGKALGWIAHLGRANTRAGARRNIMAHYDLGNAFYAAWLDSSMTYSAARFTRDGETLEAAQAEKYRSLARAADLRPGDHVLEIGCGWGGFAELAAREFGVRVTALTISEAQCGYARARIARAGLADRVEVRLQDYRDLSGRYDKAVSIEMLEAVGRKYWPLFFAKLAGALKPGGLAALQVITVRDDLFAAYSRRVDFIQRCVFPGGMLPSAAALHHEAARAGLSWRGGEHDAAGYARTLGLWAEAFAAQWPAIREQGFDERFRRFWLFYLAYCAAGFTAGRTSLARITLQA